MSYSIVVDLGSDMSNIDLDLHYVMCGFSSGTIYSWRLDALTPKGGILLVTNDKYFSPSSYDSDIEKGIGEPTDRSMRAVTKIILDLLDTMPRRKSS
ncbi:hypothetical protein H6792_00340 [Candidatus Nomurabacteria bacterium]|nr:hypothetical protein [Candidatus Nomurabacteria bacterium]